MEWLVIALCIWRECYDPFHVRKVAPVAVMSFSCPLPKHIVTHKLSSYAHGDNENRWNIFIRLLIHLARALTVEKLTAKKKKTNSSFDYVPLARTIISIYIDGSDRSSQIRSLIFSSTTSAGKVKRVYFKRKSKWKELLFVSNTLYRHRTGDSTFIQLHFNTYWTTKHLCFKINHMFLLLVRTEK